MAVSDAVRRAWQTNARVNRVFTEHLTPDMLAARTPGGGYTVAQQLAHMAEVVRFWRSLFARGEADLPTLGDPDTAPDDVETDLERIRHAFERTSDATLRAADTAPDTGRLPHHDLDAMLVHMMVHDAHHRGQIVLALKTAGHPLPDEDAAWGPWRGDRVT